MFCANEINHVGASFSNASEQSYKRLFVFNTYKQQTFLSLRYSYSVLVDIASQIAINPGGESTTVRGRISQRANKPGGESSRGRNGKGAKKPDTSCMPRQQSWPRIMQNTIMTDAVHRTGVILSRTYINERVTTLCAISQRRGAHGFLVFSSVRDTVAILAYST